MNEPKKRGGQPGNTNAQKTGMHSRRIKTLWRDFRVLQNRAHDLLDRMEETYGYRGRMRKRRRKR